MATFEANQRCYVSQFFKHDVFHEDLPMLDFEVEALDARLRGAMLPVQKDETKKEEEVGWCLT